MGKVAVLISLFLKHFLCSFSIFADFQSVKPSYQHLTSFRIIFPDSHSKQKISGIIINTIQMIIIAKI